MSDDSQQKKSESSTEPKEHVDDLPEPPISERDAKTVKGGVSPMDPLVNQIGRN